MSIFLFIGHDHAPHSMVLRDSVRAEHRAYVLAHDAMIRFAGAMVDTQGNQCGTVIAFEADDAGQVQQWVAQEPFHRSGVYARTDVVEWQLALNRLNPMDWPVARSPAGA